VSGYRLSYNTHGGLGADSVYSIAIDPSGAAWFGTEAGVSRFEGTTWTSYTTFDGLVNNAIRSIAIDPSGVVWFGTEAGISRYEPSTVP
jgi:ligand-binding sensor domain-containing protein